MFDLNGRIAVVTGGNGGIGLGMARGLSEAGARVILSGRDEAKGATAAKSIDSSFIRADVTQAADCRALMEGVGERFGRIDILVNNAGTTVRKRPESLSEAEWNGVLATNLTSAFLCSQAAYPQMRKHGGKIINIGSMLSIFGTSYGVAYAASKGGIVQLTRSLAIAWAAENIQVNAVLPGWIDTDLTRSAREEVEGLNERVLARTPAGRWGMPRDLAGVAVFLASGASDFVTGTAIPVDGGYSVQG